MAVISIFIRCALCIRIAEARKAELMERMNGGFMFKMTDDPRITKVGKFIRSTSIDELPQFLECTKG